MKRILPLCVMLLALGYLPVSAILDTNGNGFSDLWEMTYNDGNLFSTSIDPLDDPDFDGWTNEQEAAAGTNPFDPNPPDGIIRPDIVRTPAVMGVENGQPIIITPEAVTVSWPTIPGKQYALLCSPDLTSESWLTVDQPFIGNGNISEFHFQIQGDEKYFWKVAVCDVDTDGDTLTDAEEYRMGTNAFVMDSDADGMDDNVDPQPNVGCPSFADADGDGIPDEYDSQPEVSAGVAPAISSEAATISRIVNVAAGDSLVFLVNVENPDGPPVTASDLKLFVSGTEDSASFTSAGGNRFSVTWTAQVHAEYPTKVLQNLSVRFEDARKATAWLEVARLDVAEWQGMVAGLAVRYDNVTTRTFCIGGHSGGVQLAPAQWSGAFGTGPHWYRGPRNVKFYGRDPNEAPPGVNLGTLSISTGMRYPPVHHG
jgi:hypothetical protein